MPASENLSAPATGSPSAVAAQWTYDPYGEVLSSDILVTGAPDLGLGHKGLFYDRLDGPIGGASPGLIPYAHVIYHNRNRVYNPQFGRFNQRNPNQTAAALLSGSHSGRGLASVALAFNLEGWLGDGQNLYQYLGSNPLLRRDPMGLSYDPFDMVDEFIAESVGSKRAFLERIVGAAEATSFAISYIASALPMPMASVLGEVGLYAHGDETPDLLASSDGWAWLEAGLDAAKGDAQKLLAKLLGESTLAYLDTALQYETKYGTIGLSVSGSQAAGGAMGMAGGAFGIWISAGPSNHIVYELVDEVTRDTVYYGITSRNLDDRLKEHNRAFAKNGQSNTFARTIRSGMTKGQARAYETFLIEDARSRGLSLRNKIRSVGVRNKFYLEAMEWARRFVR